MSVRELLEGDKPWANGGNVNCNEFLSRVLEEKFLVMIFL